jgi:RNA polymerase sigma-70 factor (ECF subfamily)
MARVRERDVAAFETLYDTYYRLVYGIAARILSDNMAAEDVTQAVFLKVWSAPDAFRGGNFGAWLARVSRNRALDVLRSRAVRSEGEIVVDVPVDEVVDDIVFSKLDGLRLREALAALPPDQREPIELGFFGGITHEEISRRTATPLGTIKTRIRTGLRKLRASLDAGVAG